MNRRHSLRRHLVAGILAYVAILSLVLATHGYWVNERTEQSVWESLLRTEMDFFAQKQAQYPNFIWPDTDLLHMYDAESLPAAFRGLRPGVHDEVRSGGREYVVLVESEPSGSRTLALDITDQEHDESTLGSSLILSVFLVAAVMAALAYWGVERLFRPLTELTRSIPDLSPDGRGEPLAIAPGDPAEVAVMADSLNRYQERIREHVDRERTFINLASHELRTPIAVVAGSMEVALSHPDTTEALYPHLLRAHRTALAMEELAEMLLALARDPERTLRELEPTDVAEELPGIVEDYQYVARNKELTLSLEISKLAKVQAPAQVVRAIVGNLIRNAIENSDRGKIDVYATSGSTVVVEDTGHGMTSTEMSELHSRIARTGYTTTGGIGLGLIARLCAHYRWALSIEGAPSGGTRASITF